MLKTVGNVVLPLNIHGISFEESVFHVLGNCEHPIILGGNFCRQNKLKIDQAKERITRVYNDGSMVYIYLGSEGEPCTRFFRGVPCLTCKKGIFKPSLIEKVKLHTAHSQLLMEMELFLEPND